MIWILSRFQSRWVCIYIPLNPLSSPHIRSLSISLPSPLSFSFLCTTRSQLVATNRAAADTQSPAGRPSLPLLLLRGGEPPARRQPRLSPSPEPPRTAGKGAGRQPLSQATGGVDSQTRGRDCTTASSPECRACRLPPSLSAGVEVAGHRLVAARRPRFCQRFSTRPRLVRPSAKILLVLKNSSSVTN